jgi:hypothetical protein
LFPMRCPDLECGLAAADAEPPRKSGHRTFAKRRTSNCAGPRFWKESAGRIATSPPFWASLKHFLDEFDTVARFGRPPQDG